MRILHTSDWHIGRTFHTHSTLDHLRIVLGALVDVVRDRSIDVVVVAGDVFDSAMPSADSYTLLATALREIRRAGAQVIMTSGNHDSATRLGFQSEWAGLAGIHVITRPEQVASPVTVTDEHGPVHFYGIPFLEPALIRHHYANQARPERTLKTHEQVLAFAMEQIRADLLVRGGRSVVLAHCFAAGVAATQESSDVERDITAGGLDLVPVSVFEGPDYVALGHIHGRARLEDRVRYSGAPLHYSFAEAAKPRGAWQVDLGPDSPGKGAELEIEWVALPVPRRLSVLTGELEELLTEDRFAAFDGDWVSAVLTDQVRPLDAMRALQKRFPYCVTLEHRPAVVMDTGSESYAERINRQTDPDIVAGFLSFVRNGVGQTEFERDLVAELLAAGELKEVTQ
ncbi:MULTISPECIES: exonuclease SbcCD subunit D [unclassified Cryobacterium]|uniref:exonuclease SbcCD subunit D n=1 Tax=unclassified Cryobacterium TaxID=2649013 RepID=UPI002AB3C7AC|nr:MULTISPECIES: exonuclease SbcCD subunit D [unclassified Cryobacterium]MDY7541070.1 exonuclease SbcCD subunit D [Cryobacterium sp. 5B3]MEB0000534.1 exonuclease SbcCD subunit D [Cryobacterium sp. RTS3]MEB0266016.1 exonuclease SbcCD subunit D [Cryobacterium sp. 10I5]MEB0276004.1 exonuclease SbcCD subunit D [Cryobacterium sp. 5B3]